MDDAGGVGHLECVRNLYPKVQKLVERDRLSLDAVLQRRPSRHSMTMKSLSWCSPMS